MAEYERLQRQIVNLCETCVNCPATCGSTPKFGKGYGNDNVYECNKFIDKDAGLPVDTLVRVWEDEHSPKRLRYFSHFDPDGTINCFRNGASSVTSGYGIADEPVSWAYWELA